MKKKKSLVRVDVPIPRPGMSAAMLSHISEECYFVSSSFRDKEHIVEIFFDKDANANAFVKFINRT